MLVAPETGRIDRKWATIPFKVIDNVTGEGSSHTVLMLAEATPVQSDFASQVEMSMTRTDGEGKEPIAEQKMQGHFLALKSRRLLQATRLGPTEWRETR